MKILSNANKQIFLDCFCLVVEKYLAKLGTLISVQNQQEFHPIALFPISKLDF